MNKKLHVLSSMTIILLLITSSAYCTNWLYFIESSKGDKHYIDMDSLKRSSENIVSVKRKIESGDSSDPAYVISDMELDCAKVRIRTLSEKSYGPDGSTTSVESKSEWKDLNPEGIDESLYELACSLKKKRTQ